MRYDLVIFDCDGVLVDSEPIVIGVFVEMLGELGIALDRTQALRELSGTTMGAKLEMMRARLGWTAPPGFPGEFTRRIAEGMERALKPVPGIQQALAAIPCLRCVASNGTLEEVRQRLHLAGLLPGFEPHLYSAQDMARPKPAPDVYLHAAAAMGVVPGRCAVVEDSVTGVEAGVRAGMAVFGYARHADPVLLREAGATVFASMAELPALLAPAG